MLSIRSHSSALLPLGALALAAALAACGTHDQPSAASGSADLSVNALSTVPLNQVTTTISGPSLTSPKTVTLSAQGSGGSYGALISSLPVGSNYVFTVVATDASNLPVYGGQATNVAILRNHVTTVVITAQPVTPPPAFSNTVPIIGSLVVSSTNVAPGESISAKVEAQDLDAGDTITFAWSSTPATTTFSAATAATTTWTAPSTEGDVTLTIQVKDNHGATVSASIVVHVSNGNGKGQANVNVKFNNWPVVTDVSATPGWITRSAPTSLAVTASDADGDALTYLWTTNGTCAAGSFTSATSSTVFTLPVSASDTYCEFDVAVSDGHGGLSHGTVFLPVGAPASIIAPAIVDAAQSAAVVDPSTSVQFYVEALDPQSSAMTFVWSTSAGSLAGQSDSATTSQVTLTAPATASTDVVVSVVVTDALGASKKNDFSLRTATLASACAVPTSTAWKFGVMADTQWIGSDDGSNPNTVAVAIINQLNAQFVANNVRFVVQAGDLTDNGAAVALRTRALFTQALYNAGIGYFPLRGNHESTLAGAAEFKRVFPQTQNGIMNNTPADVFTLIGSVDDANTLPLPAPAPGSTFAMGSNFSSPSAGTTGLSYAFDYNNVRFVLLDQFMKFDGSASSSSSYNLAPQLPWIGTTLAGKPAGGHAFVFAHKGLITENHVDVLFGANPSVDPTSQDTFISSLASNGVRYFMGGHDHMHDRSLFTTTDGISAKLTNIVLSSDSSKFYIPANPTNDQKYDVPAFGHTRQTQFAQELNTVGYYIFTVDGANVLVDFYSAVVNPVLASGEYLIASTPVMSFSNRETFGYGLTGNEWVVAQGGSYAGLTSSFGTTTAKLLSGTNGSPMTDASGRTINRQLDTAWTAATCATASDILTLSGLADVGASSGDAIALSLTYTPGFASDADLVSGNFGIGSQNSSGSWVNAVDLNSAGSKTFVLGPWSASYPLGTYGVDPDTNTLWAVVNHMGRFAATRF